MDEARFVRTTLHAVWEIEDEEHLLAAAAAANGGAEPSDVAEALDVLASLAPLAGAVLVRWAAGPGEVLTGLDPDGSPPRT